MNSERTVYLIAVKTSDKVDAGTSAHVFIRLIGIQEGESEEKRSREIHLKKFRSIKLPPNQVDLFPRNSRTLFQAKTLAFTQIKSLIVRHDDNGLNPSWHLEKIEIYDMLYTNNVYHFHCHRWLSKDKEDGRIQLGLPCLLTKKGPAKGFPRLWDEESDGKKESDQPVHLENGQKQPLSPLNKGIDSEKEYRHPNSPKNKIPQKKRKVKMWPVSYPYGYGGRYPRGYGGHGYMYPYEPYGGCGYGNPFMWRYP